MRAPLWEHAFLIRSCLSVIYVLRSKKCQENLNRIAFLSAECISSCTQPTRDYAKQTNAGKKFLNLSLTDPRQVRLYR